MKNFTKAFERRNKISKAYLSEGKQINKKQIKNKLKNK